ncbi:hypothetical protein C5167_040260 [Papaver somniferum]|uniref:DYW domain-containing protein n=1 Tax=Papaver somniferum TaxID=3469 RepID=A0A4Y7IHY8_PAPSO|nr:pentatricopeptide repeat-containing protein At1g08070, chloroplastic-like [Papaver somniferum]RZC47321.1 hypothetical protein C5167_040260 [Papaver somniferum]
MFLNLLRSSTNVTQITQIHSQITVNGIALHSHFLSKLIELRLVDYARAFFNQIPSPTDYSWNSMIRLYTLNGFPQKSISLYSEMLKNDCKPSHFTYPSLFKACSSCSSIQLGEQIHTHVLKFGFHYDLFVNNSLIDMYCKCFCIDSAQLMLDEMPETDEVSWNSIISGYVNLGEMEKARVLFEQVPVRRNVVCWTSLINGYGRKGNLNEMFSLFLQMLVSGDEDVEPNSTTMVCLLSACSSPSDSKLGLWVSVFIDVNRIPVTTILSTALIDMNSRCGDLDTARRLFDRMSCNNLVSWNAMITGYVQTARFEEAIRLYDLLQTHSVKPNEITVVNVLSACSGLGALELGKKVHIYLGRNGLDLNVIVAAALVDMYTKCGRVTDGCLVFVKTPNKDVALYNAMILGLAYHGRGSDSLAVFAEMERNGLHPNDITFIGVLSGCNHSGLVEVGRYKFWDMVKKYGLSPKIEHYSCMVDLLGRAGYPNEAFELIQNMEISPDSLIWSSLLSSCRIHRNIELADNIAEVILSIQNPNSGSCILLSNIYASVGRWKDVIRMRRLVKEKGDKKPPGASWIELDGNIHKFVVEDIHHLQSKEIYEIHKFLTDQLKAEGYVPKFAFT